ncbi:MAG: hypothetical protein ACRD7E_10575, partial [Bryobacteraceae bacterium]
GVPTLLNTLPVRIPKLAPGTITSIVLRLDTPETVKRLALTESGTVYTDGTVPHKFSFGQALFLNSNNE